jgi:hypothetical protein
LPKRARASSSASRQKDVSIVFDRRHDSTARDDQSMTAPLRHPLPDPRVKPEESLGVKPLDLALLGRVRWLADDAVEGAGRLSCSCFCHA